MKRRSCIYEFREGLYSELQERHKRKKIEGQVRLFKGIRGVMENSVDRVTPHSNSPDRGLGTKYNLIILILCKSVFLDIIRTGKDNGVFGSEGQFSERMPEFAYQFDRMKKEKNMRTQLILRKGRKELDSKTSEHRYLPNIAESPAVTNIYGDKVAIVIWTDEPEGIIIENSAAAKAYKSYFEFMWKHAKDAKPKARSQHRKP